MDIKITSTYSPGLPLDPTRRKIVFLSAQKGCRAVCRFCGHEYHKYRGNTSTTDLETELRAELAVAPTPRHIDRLEVYFTKLGEPTMNDSVLDLTEFRLKGIAKSYTHVGRICPVVATMLPKMNPFLEDFLEDWCYLKNRAYSGAAGLQFSLYSTSESQRSHILKGLTLEIVDIAKILSRLPRPVGEKYALNFHLSNNSELREKVISRNFDPENFAVNLIEDQKPDNIANYRSFWDSAETLANLGYDVTIFEPTEKSPLSCQNVAISI